MKNYNSFLTVSSCIIIFEISLRIFFLLLSIASQMVVDGRCSPNAPFGAEKAAPAKIIWHTPVYTCINQCNLCWNEALWINH